KHQPGDPTEIAELAQSPEVEHQRRRDAEVDEVGEAVELGTKTRGALEHARDAAIDTVEQRGENDGSDRPFELVLDRKPDRRQSPAQREQRDQVRHQRAHRNEAEAPALAGERATIEGRERHGGNHSGWFATLPASPPINYCWLIA